MTDELASLEATYLGANDLASEMERDAELQRKKAKEAFAEWQMAVHGLVPGVTRLRSTSGRFDPDGSFVFVEIIDASVSFTNRPWVKASKIKKDGKPSVSIVSLFDWEKDGEA